MMTLDTQGFNNYRIQVPAEFQEVYSHFYFAENNSDQTITKTLFPTYQTMLIFNLGKPGSIRSCRNNVLELGKCIILGPVKAAFEYCLPVGAEILVINFKDDGFYRFFGDIPLKENSSLDPDNIFKQICFIDLWHSLKKIKAITEKINHILEFSRPYIKRRKAAAHAIAKWNNSTNVFLSPIKVIAQDTNQTERNIQLNYKKYLGYSAKENNRYTRFLTAVELIQNTISRSSKVNWQEIISQCNYYDQSQLIRDFKHFMNVSPKFFLKFHQDICYKNPE